MNTISYTRTVTQGGVLTNATSMTCAVTYGAGVSIANVATHPSTGIYTFTVSDAAYDRVYTFTVTTTIGGEVYVNTVTQAGPVTPTAVSATYSMILARITAKYENPTSAQIAEVTGIVADGYQAFFLARPWKCLCTETSIPLVSGTVSYDLPTNFSQLMDDPALALEYGRERLWQKSAAWVTAYPAGRGESDPRHYAITVNSSTRTISVSPTPAAAYTLLLPYRIAATALTSTTYPAAADPHANTILQSCLAIWEQRVGRTAGVETALYRDMLRQSIELDTMETPSQAPVMVYREW